MSAEKKTTVPQPKPKIAAAAKKACRAAAVGHRSCTCPACNHNAKRK
jgi:hypothetical protein